MVTDRIVALLLKILRVSLFTFVLSSSPTKVRNYCTEKNSWCNIHGADVLYSTPPAKATYWTAKKFCSEVVTMQKGIRIWLG